MRGLVSSGIVLAVMTLAFVIAVSPPQKVFAATTTTVIGWLVPDGAHFNQGIGAFLFPIVGVGIFVAIAKVTDSEGDFGITLILAGLTIGGVLAQLSINANNANVLPFALIVVPAVDLMIWMWRGQG